jgi:hypothetical protein
MSKIENEGDVLDKTVASAATVVILLQLHKFELAKRFKDILEVCLGDAEVDVAYIEPVEGDGVGMAGRFRVPDLAVLLRLGGLDNDGNT